MSGNLKLAQQRWAVSCWAAGRGTILQQQAYTREGDHKTARRGYTKGDQRGLRGKGFIDLKDIDVVNGKVALFKDCRDSVRRTLVGAGEQRNAPSVPRARTAMSHQVHVSRCSVAHRVSSVRVWRGSGQFCVAVAYLGGTPQLGTTPIARR